MALESIRGRGGWGTPTSLPPLQQEAAHRPEDGGARRGRWIAWDAASGAPWERVVCGCAWSCCRRERGEVEGRLRCRRVWCGGDSWRVDQLRASCPSRERVAEEDSEGDEAGDGWDAKGCAAGSDGGEEAVLPCEGRSPVVLRRGEELVYGLAAEPEPSRGEGWAGIAQHVQQLAHGARKFGRCGVHRFGL